MKSLVGFSSVLLIALVWFLGPLFSHTVHGGSCELEIGGAYRIPSSRTVWHITDNCTRRPFNSSRVFFTYYNTFDEVQTLSPNQINLVPIDTLGFMPMGPLYNPQYGALVKTVDDPAVYLLLGSERYWITSEAVFNALGYQWDWIEDVDRRLLDRYSVGDEITETATHPNYTLVKYPNDARVYQLRPSSWDRSVQVKWHVPDESTFVSLGYRWDRIVTISTNETYRDMDDAPAMPTFAPIASPDITIAAVPGTYTGLWVGEGDDATEVGFYIPENFDSETFRYQVSIHGAGTCHRGGMLGNLSLWKEKADQENLVVIAPNFDRNYFDVNGNRIWDVNFCDDVFVGQYNGPMRASCSQSACLNYHTEAECAFYDQYSCEAAHWSHVYGINDDGGRPERQLRLIFDYFNSHFVPRETFNLFGHSGGAQFSSRFMLMHPELVGDRVGLSSGGSYLFPDASRTLPYGTDVSDIDTDFRSDRGQDYSDIKVIDWEDHIRRVLEKRVVITGGELDEVGAGRRPWQGANSYEKAENLYRAYQDWDATMRADGRISSATQNRWSLRLLSGEGHNAGYNRATLDAIYEQ